MAANIFNPTDTSDIFRRISLLSVDSTRHWGKMTLTQMLQHCGMQLKLALGEVEQMPAEGPLFFRTAIGHWLILYVMPWPKGTSTPTQMNMLKNKVAPEEVETAKQNLVQLLKAVQQQTQLRPHPFFGKLNQKHWGRLIWKHLDHHLRQFGV